MIDDAPRVLDIGGMHSVAAEPLVVAFDAGGAVTATSPAATVHANDPARLLLARGMGVLQRILGDARTTTHVVASEWQTEGAREPLFWTALRVPDGDGGIARVVFTAFEGEPDTPRRTSGYRFNVAPKLQMWIFDRSDYRILSANALAAKRRGYSLDELLSMRITQLRPAGDVPYFVDELTALPPGHCTKTRVVHVTKGGERFELDAEIATVDADGRPACMVLAHAFR